MDSGSRRPVFFQPIIPVNTWIFKQPQLAPGPGSACRPYTLYQIAETTHTKKRSLPSEFEAGFQLNPSGTAVHSVRFRTLRSTWMIVMLFDALGPWKRTGTEMHPA